MEATATHPVNATHGKPLVRVKEWGLCVAEFVDEPDKKGYGADREDALVHLAEQVGWTYEELLDRCEILGKGG